jgi:protein-disulfide isomerase
VTQTRWLAPLAAILVAACGPMQNAGPAGGSETPQTPAASESPAASTRPTGGSPAAGSPEAAGPTPTINATSVAIAQSFQVPRKGSAEAQVVIYEFSDYLCPFCGRFARETLTEVAAKYGPDEVALVYWDFPLESHGIMALVSAEAAHCAGEQGEGRYWTMHDALFGNQAELEKVAGDDEPAAVAAAVQLAESAGLDGAAMQDCLSSTRYRPIVGALQRQALERGVEMTPTLVLVSRKPGGTEYGDPETVLGALSMADFEPYIQRSLSRAMGTSVPTPTSPPTPIPPPATATSASP